jgi:hypothetical protein
LKEIGKHGLTYTNLFEEFDEFLFEGCEIGDFTEEFKKQLALKC